MLKNYFKIAWRNLLKNKVYSSIKHTWPCIWNGGGHPDRPLDI
jgi:hypothetical protein